ncbi:UDP-4-amino-4,6-dideoxy-N-acetyl-beta-L-altrosamine N-acetyltransferase [Ornithinibacillus contaminans]|uniref:UDP-4-amino-4, 6-dideoxy-N-acetyl-beta-L-altrosamine N-acetyltransferase n=1 Tax=Ornithinibacillus contaminans TaxID=694055 RepID=UPI001F025BB1|nr:UDP-4-amino-4,6-dideoxy-N-acetyl-beta-L-altrosamine N-acetyltransferase [Ornithinibacillus contaminans]
MMKWLKIKEEHLQQILEWRSSKDVTRYMYTDIPYDLDNQRKWHMSIKEDTNGFYWVIEYKGELIGYISITDINWKHKSGYWNFYIGNNKYGMLAGFLGAYMYNFAFSSLPLNKLMGEVMASNVGVRKMHSKQGAREIGYFEKHIQKNDQWHDIFLYEMTKEKWISKGSKFHKYIPDVEVE